MDLEELLNTEPTAMTSVHNPARLRESKKEDSRTERWMDMQESLQE